MVLLIELVILYIELKYKDEPLKFDRKRDVILGILARNYNTYKTNIRISFFDSFYRIQSFRNC